MAIKRFHIIPLEEAFKLKKLKEVHSQLLDIKQAIELGHSIIIERRSEDSKPIVVSVLSNIKDFNRWKEENFPKRIE